jgi:hypothetical protein
MLRLMWSSLIHETPFRGLNIDLLLLRLCNTVSQLPELFGFDVSLRGMD